MGRRPVYTGDPSDYSYRAVTEFSVYPNPTDGIVNIDNPSGEGFNCEIYSISGKKILTGRTVNGSGLKVDLRGNSKGLYIIKIHTGGTILLQKVILR